MAGMEGTVEPAVQAGLRHSSDIEPGWHRRRQGRGFTYIDERGRRLSSNRVRGRIKKLSVPPAWADVWVCKDGRGHLQATGRDGSGRKQYIYHPHWRAHADQVKYGRAIAFAGALPALRRRVDRDLASPGGPTRARVMAAVVRLLDMALMRVGNPEYREDNGSYGLTTMEDRHVEISGPLISFSYRGKSGRKHELSLENRRLARIVRQCRDLPGQHLFSFEDSAGDVRQVHSGDVNDYIREITGAPHTAKDFRTWAGTVHTAEELHGGFAAGLQGKEALTAAIASTAGLLGNTAAVCRRSYVHPRVIASHEAGSFQVEYGSALETARAGWTWGLRLHETATRIFLQGECQ